MAIKRASRDGVYYGNKKNSEELARYQGCTHVACKYCGTPVQKGRVMCAQCRGEKEAERFLSLPEKEWNEEGVVYSEACDQYFDGWDSVNEYADDAGVPLKDLRLVICDPVPYRLLDIDYWADDFPEDVDELPEEIQDAIDNLNEVLRDAGPITFAPSRARARVKL